MQEFLLVFAPPVAGLIGYLVGSAIYAPADQEKLEHWQNAASNNWKRFVDAAKECNALETERDEALQSVNRLSSALAAKNDRLNRIASHFEGQQSGTARLVVKMAAGES